MQSKSSSLSEFSRKMIGSTSTVNMISSLKHTEKIEAMSSGWVLVRTRSTYSWWTLSPWRLPISTRIMQAHSSLVPKSKLLNKAIKFLAYQRKQGRQKYQTTFYLTARSRVENADQMESNTLLMVLLVFWKLCLASSHLMRMQWLDWRTKICTQMTTRTFVMAGQHTVRELGLSPSIGTTPCSMASKTQIGGSIFLWEDAISWFMNFATCLV